MDERISMLIALVAFIGMMILVYACIVIAQRRGVQIWSEPPPSPDSVVTTLSDEDKKKIDKLRSSAILRHLSKFTVTLNEDNMTILTSTTEEEPDKSCVAAGNTHIEKGEKDLEKGTPNEDKAHYSHICVPLPGQQSYDSFLGTDETGNTSKTASLKNDILETRNVPNLCVICHEEYVVSDKVCWASSVDCTHVFHEECIVRWLTSLGWIKLKEQKKAESMIEEGKCLNYDLECPMCRGQFICEEKMIENTPVVDAAAGAEEESV